MGLQVLAAHNYLDFPAELPERAILQIHWYRESNFQRFLISNDIRMLTLARHPLDVLLSVLHFCQYEPAVGRWLDGNVDIPNALRGADPASRAFLDYALGFGAENLLSVSYQWWHDHDAIKVRYEDLTANPVATVTHILRRLGADETKAGPALAATPFSVFRKQANRHGWQGRPGLWKTLIPSTTARAIYDRRRYLFDALGYDVENDEVSVQAARHSWTQLSQQPTEGQRDLPGVRQASLVIA